MHQIILFKPKQIHYGNFNSVSLGFLLFWVYPSAIRSDRSFPSLLMEPLLFHHFPWVHRGSHCSLLLLARCTPVRDEPGALSTCPVHRPQHVILYEPHVHHKCCSLSRNHLTSTIKSRSAAAAAAAAHTLGSAATTTKKKKKERKKKKNTGTFSFFSTPGEFGDPQV